MRKIMTMLFAIFVFSNVFAQKYIHYYMNDSTFNGFYTSMNPEIKHDPVAGTSTILLNGNEYNVPVENIDKIEIEDALVTDSFIGDYRIYEGAFEDQEYKYAFVDNRAHLLASKNGDFGANDTILFASVYNNERILFITNNNGKIQKIFDGNSLFFFDYSDGVLENVIELTSDGGMVERSVFAIKQLLAPSLNAPSCTEFITNFRQTTELTLDILNLTTGQILDNIDAIRNNPELHNARLIGDGVFVVGDIAGLAGSIWAGFPTGGLTWAGVGEGIVNLGNDVWTLMEEMFPSSEQMENYKEYYRNRYSITVKTITPENVKSDKADIRGTFSSSNGINGNLYFTLSKLTDTEIGDKITGSTEAVTGQSYIVNGKANSLKPGTNYFYMLWYECDVNGLHFTYAADNGIDFTTLIPAATTIGEESVKDRTANVKCSFSNVPDGATCGVQYGSDGSSSVATTSSSDGEKTVSLSGLSPATTYSYRAFIQYGGENYYGETLSFKTNPPDISGTWTCKETHYKVTGEEYYKTYTITLGEDGSVQTTATSSEILSSSWGLSTSGEVDIKIVDIATQTTNSGVNWSGTVDNIKNPTKITGYTNRWNFNTVGYFDGNSYAFEMIK